MQIYKGVPYFSESPYTKLSPNKTFHNTPATNKEKTYRMRVYNYSKSNAMFVKPVQKEELDNVAKTSVLCTKFKSSHVHKSYEPTTATELSYDPDHFARSINTARSRSKVTYGHQLSEDRRRIEPSFGPTLSKKAFPVMASSARTPSTLTNIDFGRPRVVPKTKQNLAEQRRELSQVIAEHRKTISELRDKEADLKLHHKVPKDVEVTPVLQKMIAVGFAQQIRSDETYCVRREAEKHAAELDLTNKAIDLTKAELKELDRQTAEEKKNVENLEKNTNEMHKRIVVKLVIQDLLGGQEKTDG